MHSSALKIVSYRTRTGRVPFVDWRQRIRNPDAVAAIFARLARVCQGDLGDHRNFSGGLSELRLHFGPGYRIYFARIAPDTLMLLTGGHKGTQHADIRKAKGFYADHLSQKARIDPGLPR